MVLIKYFYYSLYCKIARINNDGVWLISERGIDARDNGYAFYSYLMKNKCVDNFYYVISKDSPDYKKFSDQKNVVLYGSKKHYILFLTAGMLISTHLMGFSPNMPLFQKLNKSNLLRLKGKFVSLKHGITKDYLPQLNPKDTKLDLLIAGAYPEYNYILDNFGFSSDVVKYTGFARFDSLKDESKNSNIILVMPTFRGWMVYNNDEEFKKSEFYLNYNRLLNDKKLIKLLEKYNLQLVFYPHIEFQKYLKLFKSSSENVVFASIKEYDVQDLLKKSKVLITDYSSVFFDFAYMNKPVIYFQFDFQNYRKKHYKQGYFIYEENGFGPVVYNADQVIKELDKTINLKFRNDKEYMDRIKDFFKFQDQKNCERIYQEINNIQNKSKSGDINV